MVHAALVPATLIMPPNRYAARVESANATQELRCITVGAPAAHPLGFEDERFAELAAAGTVLTDQLSSQSQELTQLMALDYSRSQALSAVASAATNVHTHTHIHISAHIHLVGAMRVVSMLFIDC